MAKDKMNIQFRIKAVDAFTKTMAKLDRQLDHVKDKAEKLGTIENITVTVTGDKKAKRDLEKVGREVNKLRLKTVYISVKTNANKAWQGFRRDIGRIATLSRDVGEYFRSQLTSAIALYAPTLVSGIYSVIAALGAMLPILGVVGGGVLGLGSAFLSAGAGATAFAGLAIPSLKKVIDANNEIKELREELADTKDLKKRKEIIEKINKAYNGMTKEQRKVSSGMEKLRKTWDKLASSLEPRILNTFAIGLGIVEDLLKRLEPMFEGVARTAESLMKSLKLNIDSKDFRNFIRYLNETAAPMLETISKAVGNFAMGFANLMVAFAPLAEEMAAGLANMGRRFREWTASLGESDRFNAFLDYVSENGPKLLEILANLREGFVGIGEAFAPFASEFLDSIVDMTEKFSEWGQTLKDNPEFQEFIEFVKEEGPNFLTILRELRELLFNLAEGFAEVSRFMNPLLEKILIFTNNLLEAHPVLAIILAGLTTLVGILGSLYGAFVLVNRFAIIPFIGVLKMLWKPLSVVLNWFGRLNISAGGLAGAILRLAGRFFLISTVLLIVADTVKKHWNEIETTITVGMAIIGAVVNIGLTKLRELFTKGFGKLKEITGNKFNEIIGVFESSTDTAIEIFEKAWNFIEETVEEGMKFVKKVLDGEFGEAWELVKKQLDRIKKLFTDIWDEIVEFLEGIDLYAIGKEIVAGLARGITGAKDKVVSAVSGAVTGAISKAKGILQINSPSKVFRAIGMGTGEGFVQGIERMTRSVTHATSTMVGAAIPKRSAVSQPPTHKTYPNYERGYNDYSDRIVAAVAELREEVAKQRQLVVEMDRREVGRLVEREVTFRQDLKTKRKEAFV